VKRRKQEMPVWENLGGKKRGKMAQCKFYKWPLQVAFMGSVMNVCLYFLISFFKNVFFYPKNMKLIFLYVFLF
jgi:hypothetical protein